MRRRTLAGALAMALSLHAGLALADGSGNPAAVKEDDGKFYDAEGNPTYKVASDGRGITPIAIPATGPTPKDRATRRGSRIRSRP